MQFIVQWVRYDEADGMYHLDDSNALEHYWRINNATPDNAGTCSLIPKFLDAYQVLGKNHNEKLVDKAMDVLQHLEPITVVRNENRYAAYDIYDTSAVSSAHNMQNPELEMIYPHDITGLGYPDYEMAVNSYWHRGMANQPNIWTVDGVQAACWRAGKEAAFLQRREAHLLTAS